MSKYKPMKLESEVIVMDNKEEIKQEEESNNLDNKNDIDDTIFEYVCTKSGMYKIYLNENEKLVIKD